jgi:uncharacterized protein (TIGR03435 family)
MHRVTLGALVVYSLITPLAAQSAQSSQPSIAFEAASVRPSAANFGYVLFERNNPGYFTVRNITVRELIRWAYLARPYSVVDGPDWIDRDRFDVVAVAQGRKTFDNFEMVRTLLANRFALRVRREMREMPAYALERARGDGRLGPGLRPVTVDCVQQGSSRPSPCGFRSGRGALQATAIMWSAELFSASLDRPLVDRSGLSGQFDIDLKWTNEVPTIPGAGTADDRVTLFTALREQLGLKLEPIKAPIDVIVVEGIERPTQN